MKKQTSGWGRYPSACIDEESFVFESQLKDLLSDGKLFIPRGNGRSYGDSALGERTISNLKYDKILLFNTSEGVFECQGGITLEQVLDVIVPSGWFLPVTPGTKLITIGGAVASNVHGKNHRKDGSFSRYVIDMDVVLASKESISCSAFINTDLFEATCGGMGLTGVITRVKFKLKKIETSFMKQKQIKAANLDALLKLFDRYSSEDYLVAWIDCLSTGNKSGRGILTVGGHAQVSDLNESQRGDPLQLPSKKKLSFPVNLPSWALNSFTVKTFNFLFYAKNFHKETDLVVPYEPFFYPLDAILNWNRMYGKSGFVQYQFVLPFEAKQGLQEIINLIGQRGMGSFLTVLKVLGNQESMISFPKEGYTLALDFPVKKGVFEFLDELDKLVLQHNGRLYLTKDARMKPEMLKGYPQLDKFKAVLKIYDPNGRIRSMQSERLQLTDSN
jgi:decaprenylphospho-beta-D-ribofuranose 2-oxidase